MKLFIDCDDTLILWDMVWDEVRGLYVSGVPAGEEPLLNNELVTDISCFLSKHKNYELIVWSGGGVRYAERWRDKYLPEARVLDKDMHTPQAGDIVVDDQYEYLKVDPGVHVLAPDKLSECPICKGG